MKGALPVSHASQPRLILTLGESSDRRYIPVVSFLRRLRSLFKRRSGATAPPAPMTLAERVAMTISCRDSDGIPKVPQAGEVVEGDGTALQIMHEGTKVRAGGYQGDWMVEVIRSLRGHHEPQEELLFHAILRHVRPNTAIVELGAFWAYYTNWFLGAVPGATAVCLEPDEANLALARENLALNGRKASVIHGCVGRHHGTVNMTTETTGKTIAVECFDAAALFQRIGGIPVEILHMDVQGAELPFLESMAEVPVGRLVRFLFVSTHHAAISGSPHTHAECVRQLRKLGATILVEHDIGQSFSGDGLIVASFQPDDAGIRLPAISRNRPEHSLFRG